MISKGKKGNKGKNKGKKNKSYYHIMHDYKTCICLCKFDKTN